MTQSDVNEFVRRAEGIYASRLRAVLEPEHLDEFVAIEPESGDYFLGQTLNDATRAARQAYPGRLTHAMRVGHRAAVHLPQIGEDELDRRERAGGGRALAEILADLGKKA